MSEQIAWTFANSRSSAVSRTCPLCRTIHCARDVVAVNRFDAHLPTRYMPAGGGVSRATRAEAMADVCATRRETEPETDQPKEGDHA